MKKILSLIAVMMLCVVSANASKVVYLNPGVWDADDATERYAVYVFNSETDNSWVAFEKDGDLYKADIDDKWANIILVRLNGETTELNWDNKWNQSADIKMAGIADQTLFVMSDWGAYNTVPYDLYCDKDAIAIDQLIEVVDSAAKGEASTEELQNAIDAVVASNADQEKDETAKVATNGWKKFDGNKADLAPDWAAPAVTTYDGRSTQPAEVYETNVDRTGTIIYQDITGLTNGKYKVGFYGTAYYTNGRGFDSTMEDGSNDVAYVFANEEKSFITARIGVSFSEYSLLQFDVEVTDGNIKLGLGKDKAGTNWHTMQIYQLTWFTTAKEVFAALQKELKETLEDAKALYADESKTQGRDVFKGYITLAEEGVDSKYFTIKQVEDILKDLKQGMADFKKANWYIGFPAGEYYIIDAESGLMMAAGHNYGTRGILNEMGLDLTLTPYELSRTVTIDSRVSNGGNSQFLGENLYMDSSEWGWALEYQGFGFFILEPNSGKYINIDSDNNLVLSDTPREFIIVTKDGVMEERLAELAEATAEKPVDATFLLQNPNFNRNDLRVEAWEFFPSGTEEDNPDFWNNHNFNGGNQINNCAESYHAAFTARQTVSGAPAGKYTMTAQGFFRQDGTVDTGEVDGEGNPITEPLVEDAPQFFANGVNVDVPARTGSEDSMSKASESFTSGLYTIDPITFTVANEGEDAGMIWVGVFTDSKNQWVIFDNFKLTYYGKDVADAINEVSTASQKAAQSMFNLAGQRVMNAQKGLYIINGKKVIK